MADNRDTRLNLAVLQRLDNSISSIIDFASQVALYKFSSEANEWQKTEIEGALFVYFRSRKPQHGFIVMNRVNTTNFTEPITRELEFQIQNPFLLYRNGKGHIHGIWFYEKGQCDKIGRLLEGLSRPIASKKKGVADKQRQLSPRHQKNFNNNNNFEKMDIMSLLTRAQEEYDKRNLPSRDSPLEDPGKTMKQDILKPTPIRANGLVANDGTVSLDIKSIFSQLDGKQENAPRLRSYSSHNASNPSANSGEDILQKLMSEASKQEKNLKKTRRARSATYSSVPIPLDSQASVEMVEHDLKKKLNLLSSPESTPLVQEPKPDCSKYPRQNVSRTEAVDIPILTPAMLELSSSLPTASELPLVAQMKGQISNEYCVPSSFPLSSIPKPPSPPLLSPMDFKLCIKNSSSSLDESPPSPPELRASLFANRLEGFEEEPRELLLPHKIIESTHSSQKLSHSLGITPLTKDQLREALTYMIQNDDDFIHRLHENYLESLRSRLNGHKSS